MEAKVGVEAERGCAGGLPRTWHLVFATGGPLVLTRDPRPVRVERGSVVLQEPSGCFGLSAVTAAPPVRALILHVPETALALPGEVLHQMSGRPAPTGSGPAALLASFVCGLAAHVRSADARHTAWLGTAAVSLATVFLDSETAPPHDKSHPRPGPAVPAVPGPVPGPVPSGTDLLVRDIKAYVEHHLHDPDLAPAAIAAAGHISLRYLHHLFRRDGQSVGAFLRERRLEHCKAELSDPAQAQRRVCEIARRWGFRDPAVFNRTFKSAYGVAPGTYRRQRLQDLLR
ncbi:helix-turn-helix transcriptional regulator [Streptomyces sp. NPDC047000]|uniref:helix-turn-helix transcriptional regulator n=1 Tax=Streptomyces sp. NPDC047000 TaxID=3155474 RepID=UPI0033F28964